MTTDWKSRRRYEHACGWVREYDTDVKLMFDHPMWGERTSKELAELDVREHRCDYYLQAKERAAVMRAWYRNTVWNTIGNSVLDSVPRRDSETV